MRRTKEEIRSYAKKRNELCARIRELIVEQLYLDLDPDFLGNDSPLFGRGLELDSIDALELAVGIYDKFNVTISDGDTSVFGTVNTMADYIMSRQEEESPQGDENPSEEQSGNQDEL